MVERTRNAVVRAEAKLRSVLANPPCRRSADGLSTTFYWERPQYRAFEKFVDHLPEGVDPDLLHQVLVAYGVISPATSDEGRAPELAPAIVRFLESREHDDPASAFVAVAMRTGRGSIHERLQSLMAHTRAMEWIGKLTRRQYLDMIAGRPDILEGARAAAAIEKSIIPSRYAPLLLAEGSPDSLDIVFPRIEALCAAGETYGIREHVLPLLGDTPAAQALLAIIGETIETRPSEPNAFLLGIGHPNAPERVSFTLTFRDASKIATYQLKCDSTAVPWLVGRLNAKWRWGAIAPGAIAAKIDHERTTDYVLRVTSRGVDRDVIDRWARSLLSAS